MKREVDPLVEGLPRRDVVHVVGEQRVQQSVEATAGKQVAGHGVPDVVDVTVGILSAASPSTCAGRITSAIAGITDIWMRDARRADKQLAEKIARPHPRPARTGPPCPRDDLLVEMTKRRVPRSARGLRGSQLRLLTLAPPEGARVTGLAEHLGMTKQALGEFANAVEARGLRRHRAALAVRDRRPGMGSAAVHVGPDAGPGGNAGIDRSALDIVGL